MHCSDFSSKFKQIIIKWLRSSINQAIVISIVVVLLVLGKTTALAQTRNLSDDTSSSRESVTTYDENYSHTDDYLHNEDLVLGSSTQQRFKPAPAIRVSAHVGEFILNISGLASPFASIVLTSHGVFYRTTTADANGYWEIDDISINRDFSDFCLEHIDFRNLGSSTTCLQVNPAQEDITKRDIFLPPTIGLQRSTIAAGGSAVIFGYTMPNATVTIHVQNGKNYEVTADSQGYYELEIKNMPAGTYQLYATAVYNGKPSETPTTTVKLTALTWWQQLLELLKKLFQWLWDIITGFGLGPLWLLLPLIPLIIYLIVRIWPEKFTFVYDSEIYVFFHPKKKLHHAWFVGY